jgi:ribosomal protein S18 acetylase RimI-like enzyme
MTLLRAATPADVPVVLDLWREAEAEPTHTDNFESVNRLLVRDPASLIVAEAEGRVVGSVIAGWDGWRGSIYRLAVAPSHRRRGLGRQLVRAAEERLTEAGASRLHAIVVETEVGATAFWRASGWEEQSERLRFVRG